MSLAGSLILEHHLPQQYRAIRPWSLFLAGVQVLKRGIRATEMLQVQGLQKSVCRRRLP